MAKNYTFSEAVNIIAEGKDLESIADIGRRYPVLATKIAVVAAKAGDTFTDLMSFMPDYLTANKVNAAIKNSITGSGATEDEDANDENETVEDAGEDTETTVQWDESMNAKQLWDILGKAGKRKLAKSTKKADLVEACKQAFGAATKVEAEDDEAEDEVENPYEGKSAMELFKECKARKIKAAPKKPAKFYVDLLLKDDEAKAAAAEDEADDDWGDEEEAEAPKKEEKKTSKGGKTKAEKKSEAESDDDDDWDI